MNHGYLVKLEIHACGPAVKGVKSAARTNKAISIPREKLMKQCEKLDIDVKSFLAQEIILELPFGREMVNVYL